MGFGDWLELRIAEIGLLKSDLAIRLNVSPSAVSRWLSGETQPARRHIPALARSLGISVYEIYLRLERIPPRPEIGQDWEIFIYEIEQLGPEFKHTVLAAVEDMQHAWFVRPRSLQTYLRVSIEEAIREPVGVRGAGFPQDEILLYAGSVTSKEEESADLLLTATRIGKEYQIDGWIIGLEVSRACIYGARTRYCSPVVDNRFVFEHVPVTANNLLFVLET